MSDERHEDDLGGPTKFAGDGYPVGKLDNKPCLGLCLCGIK